MRRHGMPGIAERGDHRGPAPGARPNGRVRAHTGDPHRLLRLLRAGADRQDDPRQHLLRFGQTRRRRRDRPGACRQRPQGRAAALHGPRHGAARTRQQTHEVLQAAAAHRPAELRVHRPREHRRIHRPRRLRSPGQSARHAARPRVAGDHRLRPAGARRRRFPHRPEVEDHARCESRPQIRGLQRRRRGSGRIHGPFDPRRRSPLDPRSDGHQRLLHGRLARTDLHPRRIPAGHRTAQASHRTGAGIRAAGQRHPGLGLLVRHRAALRRGRLRLRRGDGADSFDGRQTRRTDRETPVPERIGLQGLPDQCEQRRNLRQYSAHPPAGRRMVLLDRHRKEQGHQSLRPGGQGQ